jgi:hypothetical protein
MEFADRVLKCVQCNAEFVFTAGEQFFFREKHFENAPKRCKECKAKRGSKVRRIVPNVERPQRFRLSLPVARRFCAVLAFRGNLKPTKRDEPRARRTRCRALGLNYDFGHNNSSLGFVMQERKQFVVTCKDCHRAVPSGAKEFPFHSIEETCPLCGEKHRYLPSEVFLGRPERTPVLGSINLK